MPDLTVTVSMTDVDIKRLDAVRGNDTVEVFLKAQLMQRIQEFCSYAKKQEDVATLDAYMQGDEELRKEIKDVIDRKKKKV